MKDLTYLKLPSMILAAGLALLGGSLLIGNWHSWEPASFPIDLRPGKEQQSPAFRVDLTTTYLIELEVERNMPFEQLNCLLGVDPGFPEHCRAIPSPVDLEWSVFASGKLVAKGASHQEREGAWGPRISRTVGRFQSKKGEEYLVQIKSLSDGSMLAPAKPRITIRAHPIESKTYHVLAQLVAWIAFTVIAVSLLWYSVGILVKQRR